MLGFSPKINFTGSPSRKGERSSGIAYFGVQLDGPVSDEGFTHLENVAAHHVVLEHAAEELLGTSV